MFSVGTVVLRFLLQALPRDTYWVWWNSTETEKRCPNLKESLHIQILLCLILFLNPPAELVDHYFSYKSFFVINLCLHNNQLTTVLCSVQDRYNSIQYTDTLVPDSLHIIYLVLLNYHCFICSVCFLENIFLQVGIWFKLKFSGGTRRMPTVPC